MTTQTRETSTEPVLQYCEELDDVTGAYRSSQPASSNYTASATIQYACVYTHTQIGGNLTRVCMKEGKWSGSPPQCVKDNVQAYLVGTIIAVVGLCILAIFSVDFLRFQRKRARVREVSQRRFKHESAHRPTAFFIQKLPYDEQSLDGSTSSLANQSESQTVPQLPDLGLSPPKSRTYFTPTPSDEMRNHGNRIQDTADIVENNPKPNKKRKRKLIPRQRPETPRDVGLNTQIQSTSTEPLYPSNKAGKGKRGSRTKKKTQRVGPDSSDESYVMNTYTNTLLDGNEVGNQHSLSNSYHNVPKGSIEFSPPLQHHNASVGTEPNSDIKVEDRPVPFAKLPPLRLNNASHSPDEIQCARPYYTDLLTRGVCLSPHHSTSSCRYENELLTGVHINPPSTGSLSPVRAPPPSKHGRHPPVESVIQIQRNANGEYEI